MKNKLIYLLVLPFFLFTCQDEELTKGKAGYFTLSEIKSSEGGRLGSTSEVITDFDLGDIKASREFFFLLGNGGDNPITDITISTDNPKFIVSPKKISTLGGTDTLIPLISLGIIHGLQLNGVGYTELLEMGENSTVLTITGKTIEKGVTIDLKSEFNFKVNAKKVDFTLLDNGEEIDFSTPDYSGNSGVYGYGSLGFGGLSELFGYETTSNNLTIKNVGNTDIRVIAKSYWLEDPPFEILLSPNQIADITLVAHPVDPALPDRISALFIIDGNGTIADYTRFQIGNDGKIYFMIN